MKFASYLGWVLLAFLAFVVTVYFHFKFFHLSSPSTYPQQPIELYRRGAFILTGVGAALLLLALLIRGAVRRVLVPIGIGATLGGLAGFALIPLYLG